MKNKYRRIVNKIFFVILIMLVFVSGVNATTGPIVKSNYRLYYDSETEKVGKKDLDVYPENSFFYKSSSNKSYICYTGINVPSQAGVSCKYVLNENNKKI